jgi:hypothetical protein
MLLPLIFLLLVAFLAWVVYHFLFELPSIDTPADHAFLKGKVVWITGASSGIGEGSETCNRAQNGRLWHAAPAAHQA